MPVAASESSTLELTEEQVPFFRARRGHLAGPGAPDLVAAAVAEHFGLEAAEVTTGC